MADALLHSRKRIAGLVNTSIQFIPAVVEFVNYYTGTGPNSSSFTINSVTVGSQPDQLMVVMVGSTTTVTSVVWNSGNLSNKGTYTGTLANSSIWYVANPAQTTGNITINCGAGSYAEAICYLFRNVNQSNPLGTVGGVQGQTSTVTINVSGDSRGMAVSALKYWDNSSPYASSSVMTLAGNPASDGAWRTMGAYAAGQTTIPLTWTGVLTTYNAVMAGCAVNPTT